MTDWCLVETLRIVAYGSSNNMVRWKNVPKIVILNVPDEIELTKDDLLHVLDHDDIHGPNSSLYSSIAGEGLIGSPPKYALAKLGVGLPDQEMKTHLTENHVYEMRVYDWLSDTIYQKSNSPYRQDWYDSTVKNEFEFYSRYDILPHDGWKFWHYHLATEEAKKK